MNIDDINIFVPKYVVGANVNGYDYTVFAGTDYDSMKNFYNVTVKKYKDSENAYVYLLDLDKNTNIDFFSTNDEK